MNTGHKMPYIICIEGNIGAGKSTLLNELESRGYTVFREQNDRDAHRHDWLWALNNCYSDPKRWACTLQLAIINSMAEQKKTIDKINSPFVFVERCPLSTTVFTNLWKKQECLSDDEFNLINGIYDMLEWKPDFTLMLTTPPLECFQRMIKRGRECESSMSLDYITDVASEYSKVYADAQFIPLDHTGSVSDVVGRTLDLIFRYMTM